VVINAFGATCRTNDGLAVGVYVWVTDGLCFSFQKIANKGEMD
jgi:hypothetical protein